MKGKQQVRRGIGADPEKSRLPEGKHPRIAAHDVPGHPQHAEHKDEDHDMYRKSLRDHEWKSKEQCQHNDGDDYLFNGELFNSSPPHKPFRPDPYRDEVDHKDDRVLVCRIKVESTQGLRQADQNACNKGPFNTAEASKSDNGKSYRSEKPSDLRINVIVSRQKSTRHADEGSAESKANRVDPLCVDPHEER